MSTRSTGLLMRPSAYRAPDEHGSSRRASFLPASRPTARPVLPDSETDQLLRRSHALVEQLRRAVEARRNLL
ncbi:MAG: hypothetical protein SFU56_13140 [Capsulimonadales bacterium]|nr:hypothetical protein [Capsulimonadales bacterium]